MEIPRTSSKLENHFVEDLANGRDASTPSEQSQTESSLENVCNPSFFSYFHGELRRGYFLENDEQRYEDRREKFYNFFKIPRELEKFIWYGYFQCADAFLFVFTFLPLRFCMSIWLILVGCVKTVMWCCFGSYKSWALSNRRLLQPAEICDLLKGIILLVVFFTVQYVDTSVLYHMVKSQSVIKLYIFFNMLEVADRLFSNFGQDIIDALFWTATEPRGRKREHLGVIPHLALAICYVTLHCILVMLQATTLNVAINSQNKALFTIMLSNNFVELKAMVFKKFEKNNLFQMCCSDVRERFHYSVLLMLVALQTLKEYAWKEEAFWALLPCCLAVLLVEPLVDWIKHAFVTRFNEISHDVYSEYITSLAYDLASSKLKNAYSDHSDLVARRMGFIPLPLGALVLRVVWGCLSFRTYAALIILVVFYFVLISWKVLINIWLLGRACAIIEQHRNDIKEKLPQPRQCASLPGSRRASKENLTCESPTKTLPRSQPISANQSLSSSLADISAHAEILQENMDTGQIFADSTVNISNIGRDEDDLAANLMEQLDVLEKEQQHLVNLSHRSTPVRTASSPVLTDLISKPLA